MATSDDEFERRGLVAMDSLLAVVAEIDVKHNMAGMLFESVMGVREILCCWNLGVPHNVASESISRRFNRSMWYLQNLSKKVPASFSGNLKKMSAAAGKGWQQRFFSIKDNKMLFSVSESDTSHKQINLNQELQCEEVNQAKEPEFKFTDASKTFRFQCESDYKRLVWQDALTYYSRKRTIYNALEKLSIPDQLKLFRDSVLVNCPAHKQYLFACVEPGDENDPRPQMDPRLPFDMVVPAVLSKDKNYTFTFKLDTKPRRLEIAAVGERPHITINREDFFDYQIKTSAKVTELFIYFQAGKEKQVKSFRFKTQTELKRFVQVLNAYRRVNSGFLFFHGDAINKLADDEAKATESKVSSPGSEKRHSISAPPPEGYQERQQQAPPPKARRDPPSGPSGPPAPPEAEWYYLTKDTQQKGPVNNEGLKEALLCGEMDVDCRVWEISMGAEWAPVRNLPVLFAWIQPAPPAPVEDYSYGTPAPPGPPPGPPGAPPGAPPGPPPGPPGGGYGGYGGGYAPAPPGPPPGPPGAPPGAPPGPPPGPPGAPPGAPPSGGGYGSPSPPSGGGGGGGGGGDRGNLLAQIQAGKRLKKTETVEKGGLDPPSGGGGPPPGGPPPKKAPLSMQEEMALRQQKMRRG